MTPGSAQSASTPAWTYRRRGLTRAVLLEELRRMRALGMERVSVSTDVGNVASRGLYGSVGFCVENEWQEYVQLGEPTP